MTMQECAEQPKLKKCGLALSVFFTLKICGCLLVFFLRWGFVSGSFLLEIFLVGVSASEEAAALRSDIKSSDF